MVKGFKGLRFSLVKGLRLVEGLKGFRLVKGFKGLRFSLVKGLS